MVNGERIAFRGDEVTAPRGTLTDADVKLLETGTNMV